MQQHNDRLAVLSGVRKLLANFSCCVLLRSMLCVGRTSSHAVLVARPVVGTLTDLLHTMSGQSASRPSCLARPGRAAAGRAPPVQAVARPQAARGGVREVERSSPAPKVVVEVGAGGRRRAVELGRGGGSESLPPATSATTAFGSGGQELAPGGPLEALRGLFLPSGWPHSVTPDYLNYQLATVPAHITGWMSHSLATSSMIQVGGQRRHSHHGN